MRTTIDLSPAHRARLLQLAAERGEKGFSRFIAEALDAYLDGPAGGDGRKDVRRLRGILDQTEAKALEKRVRSLREGWR